jgi:hypothetical protein
MTTYTEAHRKYLQSDKGKETRKRWRRENRETHYGYQKSWRQRNYWRNRLNTLRAKCVSQGLEFDLEVSALVIPDVCPALGIALDFSDRDHTPSLDRVEPKGGYTKDNVRVISGRANRIKSDASCEELLRIYEYVLY